MSNAYRKIFFALCSFLFPLIIILLNANFSNLGFADASEFALLTKICGVAHAPGFPSYIISGFLFTKLLSVFGVSHLAALVIFSATTVAAACMLLFLSARLITERLFADTEDIYRDIICLIAAVTPAAGITIWHWAHSVEVYGFQVLSTALLFYGLIWFEISRKNAAIIIAAVGFALGLTNHHLSTILLSPFILLMLSPGWLSPKIKDNKKKNAAPAPFLNFIKEKPFRIFCITVFSIIVFFYGWIMLRANATLSFAFGNPDTLDRLFYHLIGGAWIKNTQQEVKGIVAMRFPYFMKLTYEQFFFFIPFLIAGFISLVNLKQKRFLLAVTGYYFLVLIYQLRIDQTSDTDAYMVSPFFLLALLLPAGMIMILKWNKKLIFLFPVLLLLQINVNFPKSDLRSFDVSSKLMRDLDKATPKGSVVLFADWTSVITYNYYRNAFNFRPDLFVLNYDIKFTNYKLLERNYPSLYEYIKPEYDCFITLLGTAHPQEIYNTGCTLDTKELLDAYVAVINKLQAFTAEHNSAFMADPKAYITLTQYGVFKNAVVSGCLVADHATGLGKDFPKLDYQWLDIPHTLMDPGASDKLVDLEASLDFNRNYYRQTGNNLIADEAENSFQRIKFLQREMKRNMPFLFRRNE